MGGCQERPLRQAALQQTTPPAHCAPLCKRTSIHVAVAPWGKVGANSAPSPALEEAICYLENRRVTMDFANASNRNCVADMSDEPNSQQVVLLLQVPRHVADPVLGPARHYG